jgi:hypothetical protein
MHVGFSRAAFFFSVFSLAEGQSLVTKAAFDAGVPAGQSRNHSSGKKEVIAGCHALTPCKN